MKTVNTIPDPGSARRLAAVLRELRSAALRGFDPACPWRRKMNRPTLAARLLAVIERSPLRPLFCELQGAFPDVPPPELAAALDELFDFGQIGALPQGAENPVGESAANHAAHLAHAAAKFEGR